MRVAVSVEVADDRVDLGEREPHGLNSSGLRLASENRAGAPRRPARRRPRRCRGGTRAAREPPRTEQATPASCSRRAAASASSTSKRTIGDSGSGRPSSSGEGAGEAEVVGGDALDPEGGEELQAGAAAGRGEPRERHVQPARVAGQLREAVVVLVRVERGTSTLPSTARSRGAARAGRRRTRARAGRGATCTHARRGSRSRRRRPGRCPRPASRRGRCGPRSPAVRPGRRPCPRPTGRGSPRRARSARRPPPRSASSGTRRSSTPRFSSPRKGSIADVKSRS